jgi:hypothetical protein
VAERFRRRAHRPEERVALAELTLCKQDDCAAEIARTTGRGRPPSYCPEHGTNRACLARKRRAQGVKKRVRLDSPVARELRKAELEDARRERAKESLKRIDRERGYWSDGHALRVVDPKHPWTEDQNLQERFAKGHATYGVIGQSDLRADWHEDGYVTEPGKYASEHEDARKPPEMTATATGLVWRHPTDWPWS